MGRRAPRHRGDGHRSCSSLWGSRARAGSCREAIGVGCNLNEGLMVGNLPAGVCSWTRTNQQLLERDQHAGKGPTCWQRTGPTCCDRTCCDRGARSCRKQHPTHALSGLQVFWCATRRPRASLPKKTNTLLRHAVICRQKRAISNRSSLHLQHGRELSKNVICPGGWVLTEQGPGPGPGECYANTA